MIRPRLQTSCLRYKVVFHTIPVACRKVEIAVSLTDETDAKIARYILEASRGERLLAPDELGEIQEHVADA